MKGKTGFDLSVCIKLTNRNERGDIMTDRMEIVFYDIETTIPSTDMIEFGAIVLDKTGLYEKESYSTLLKSNKINARSIECNGITFEMVKNAPTFEEVADDIYNVLNNRIWAGHNILGFDNLQIVKNFERIGRTPPVNIGIIDTLPLLRNTFGYRAGDLKMATLGNYFGLGQERHRALEDCRMTIDVLKNCSLTIFLEENTGYDSFVETSEKVPASGRDEIANAIDRAIENGESVWINYDGGSNPLVPRQISPIRWEHRKYKLEAFCHQSQTHKFFSQRKIVEIRKECWEVEEEKVS
jgi:DNA polymerase III epsilon subunit-like protein